MSDNKKMAKGADFILKFAKPIIKTLEIVLPLLINFFEKAYTWYGKLPTEAITLFIGYTFCFFGGIYPMLFASIQAAKHGGFETLVSALSDLSEEALKIIEASKKDDHVDADNDGIKDVKEISNQALVLRKVKLVVTKMNPNKVDNALSSIHKVWLSVVAVLAVEFARTIALAVSISEFLKKPSNRIIKPAIQALTPDEYDKWVPVVLGWVTKGIGMSIAYYVQAVISAFTSAMIGSLMMSRAIIRMLKKRGFSLRGLIAKDHEDSNLDEILGYILAAIGFYTQFSLNFSTPFPFNYLLFPFESMEQYIRWAVTKVD